jgi:hypothetical protein
MPCMKHTAMAFATSGACSLPDLVPLRCLARLLALLLIERERGGMGIWGRRGRGLVHSGAQWGTGG